MINRQSVVAAAALVAMSIVPLADVASAMPVGGPLAIKNAAPAQIETVQWRGGWRGGRGGWRGGGWGWGVGAGFLGGAIVGGMLASPYYYGPGPYYPYPAPAYGPAPGGAVAYCMQRFKSYDPASGTYLGYDGLRHPCP